MCVGGAIYITHSSAPMPPTYFFSPLSQKLDLNARKRKSFFWWGEAEGDITGGAKECSCACEVSRNVENERFHIEDPIWVFFFSNV